MKTKWRLYILWSVLSLGLLSCALDTYESPFTRKKRVFKVGTPKSKSIKQPRTEDRRSSERPGTPLTPPPKVQSGFAHLPDVSVTCSTSDLVVRVKPSFFGLGADAQELKLGRDCESNGVLRPYGDLLFTYPLTACGAVRESPRGYLLYKFVLHYEPSPKRFPSRAHRIDVDIECRYQRNHHVYQLTVQPTWETAVVRKRLKGSPNDFQMELMDDSWSRPVKSQVYQLGKTVRFQLSAPHLSSGGKLYISSCYASPSSGSKSSLKYAIIDNFGCMLDSKSDPGASQFVSRTDKTLRFSLKAFQFTSDPDTEVKVHCKLLVTSEDPGPAHKSCTYRGNGWKALTGDDSICECCDSQCVTSKSRRAMMEGSASSGSLLVSDQAYTEDDFLPISMSREVNHDINELHSHEDLWESVDEEQDYTDDDDDDGDEEEEEEQLEEEEGVLTEAHSDELGLREKNKSEVEYEEEGSGYVQEEEEEEVVFEGREGDIHSHQEEAEMLRHWVELDQMFLSEVVPQRKFQPLVSEREEGHRKHAGGGEEDEEVMGEEEEEWKNDGGLADSEDDGEMTWYFTWR